MTKNQNCPLSSRCGGCDYIDMSYDEELDRKQYAIEDILGGFGRVSPIIPSEKFTHYRCKIQAVCGMRGGKLVTGIYRRGTHLLVPVEKCLLEDSRASEVLRVFRALANRFNLPAYDEDSGTGILRHVLIRTSSASGEALVAIVASSTDFPHAHDMAAALHQRLPFVKGVVAVENREKTSMVIPEGAEERTLYGKPFIREEILGLSFKVSASSFFQVNPLQAAELYSIAMDMAEITKGSTAMDAYCGTGTITLIAASRGAGKAIGIEANASAAADARANARENKLGNAVFIEGDASKVLKDMAKAGDKCDTLFLDPPRAGSTEEFLASASRLAPNRIVYISCNPVTLARDLRYVRRFTPYSVAAIQPVDMFPASEHVETVVLLRRRRQGR